MDTAKQFAASFDTSKSSGFFSSSRAVSVPVQAPTKYELVLDATLRGAADFSHLWTHPILLDGTKYTARFGAIPLTPLADAVATTLAWHRAHPELRLNA